MLLLLSLSFSCCCVYGSFLFGPTADLLQNITSGPPDFALSISQLLGLVNSSAGLASWSTVLASVTTSHGALHVRDNILAQMTRAEQAQLAHAASAANLSLSLESGGAFCSSGSGTAKGLSTAGLVRGLHSGGGNLAYLLIESVFSRTFASCPSQSHSETIKQVTQFAAAVAAVTPTSRFFLYDALPHFSVGGAAWPPNVPGYGLDLGAILAPLQASMHASGVPLAGYWADCPFDYSAAYPNSSQPLPFGEGWRKVAAAVELVHGLGLEMGKTYNSQSGGTTSGALFWEETLWDVGNCSQALEGAGLKLDNFMVETWYPFPRQAAPETVEFTTAYTARAVIERAALTTGEKA